MPFEGDAQAHHACRMIQQEVPLLAVLVIFLCDFAERLFGQRKVDVIPSSDARLGADGLDLVEKGPAMNPH